MSKNAQRSEEENHKKKPGWPATEADVTRATKSDPKIENDGQEKNSQDQIFHPGDKKKDSDKENRAKDNSVVEKKLMEFFHKLVSS